MRTYKIEGMYFDQARNWYISYEPRTVDGQEFRVVFHRDAVNDAMENEGNLDRCWRLAEDKIQALRGNLPEYVVVLAEDAVPPY